MATSGYAALMATDQVVKGAYSTTRKRQVAQQAHELQDRQVRERIEQWERERQLRLETMRRRRKQEQVSQGLKFKESARRMEILQQRKNQIGQMEKRVVQQPKAKPRAKKRTVIVAPTIKKTVELKVNEAELPKWCLEQPPISNQQSSDDDEEDQYSQDSVFDEDTDMSCDSVLEDLALEEQPKEVVNELMTDPIPTLQQSIAWEFPSSEPCTSRPESFESKLRRPRVIKKTIVPKQLGLKQQPAVMHSNNWGLRSKDDDGIVKKRERMERRKAYAKDVAKKVKKQAVVSMKRIEPEFSIQEPIPTEFELKPAKVKRSVKKTSQLSIEERKLMESLARLDMELEKIKKPEVKHTPAEPKKRIEQPKILVEQPKQRPVSEPKRIEQPKIRPASESRITYRPIEKPAYLRINRQPKPALGHSSRVRTGGITARRSEEPREERVVVRRDLAHLLMP